MTRRQRVLVNVSVTKRRRKPLAYHYSYKQYPAYRCTQSKQALPQNAEHDLRSLWLHKLSSVTLLFGAPGQWLKWKKAAAQASQTPR